MWWLLLVFGVVGVCVTICMKLSDGLVSSGLASSPARAAIQEAYVFANVLLTMAGSAILLL